MNEFINNYIFWKHEIHFTEKQKIRRLEEVKKYMLCLFEKMYCSLNHRSSWEKIVDKFYMLYIEFNDLTYHLKKEDEVKLLGQKIMKIKLNSDFCLRCEEGVDDINRCICVDCENCKRVRELCRCLKK